MSKFNYVVANFEHAMHAWGKYISELTDRSIRFSSMQNKEELRCKNKEDAR